MKPKKLPPRKRTKKPDLLASLYWRRSQDRHNPFARERGKRRRWQVLKPQQEAARAAAAVADYHAVAHAPNELAGRAANRDRRASRHALITARREQKRRVETGTGAAE